ncbi:MAG TPA: DUF4404 family protein [Acidimicrobiia bacterium]|nr:DUF4404 family protein [Acidimicrobiia bacterium]
MEQHLRHLLDELQSAIGRTREDQPERDELTRLHGAVSERLQGEAPAGEDTGLVDRLKKAELLFEADHPGLGASLRQAVESLTAGGI